MFSVKPQRTNVVWEGKEKKTSPFALGRTPYLGHYQPYLYCGELSCDSGMCSKCHFHLVLCFPHLQRCIHLLDSQPTQQPYKLCSCGIWSEYRSFWFGNSSELRALQGWGSAWNKTCFCYTGIFETARSRHILMWLVLPVKNNAFPFAAHFLFLHTCCF